MSIQIEIQNKNVSKSRYDPHFEGSNPINQTAPRVFLSATYVVSTYVAIYFEVVILLCRDEAMCLPSAPLKF